MKLLLLSISFLLTLVAQASDFRVSNLKYSTNSDGTSVTISGKYGILPGYLGLPSSVQYAGKTYLVNAIADSTFAGCTELKNVNMSVGITSIGKAAFYGCTGIATVTLPSSITSIADYLFAENYNLKYFTIPSGVTSIGEGAFQGCRSIVSMTIPKNITSIGGAALEGCYGLRNLYVINATPPAVDNSFSEIDKDSCTLYMPDGSKAAYEKAEGWSDFKNMDELENTFTVDKLKYTANSDFTYAYISGHEESISGEFQMSNYVTYKKRLLIVNGIGDSALYNCDSITSFLIWDCESYFIGKAAFQDCDRLSLIGVNAHYKISVGDYAFAHCPALENVGLPFVPVPTGSSVQSFGSNTDETEVESTPTQNYIGAYAFSDCPTISYVEIIADSIATGAFQDCSGLKNFESHSLTPPTIDPSVFEGVNQDSCALIVPKGAMIAYVSADIWKDFTPIYAISTSVPKNEASQATIFTESDGIVVKGAEAGTSITVYSASGFQLVTLTANDDEQRIALPAGALYLVKVGDQAFKVAM